MIDLLLFAQFESSEDKPFVAKIIDDKDTAPIGIDKANIGTVVSRSLGTVCIETDVGQVLVESLEANLVGDVLFFDPPKGTVQRWFRRGDTTNTLLVTERCDQLCTMCSQPPKKTHVDLFEHFETACLLADIGADIGLSGGEPTLFKEQVFQLIENVKLKRPDLSFHVLTNAQHFGLDDVERLRAISGVVMWGVPVYSSDPQTHDKVVGKQGAFERLQKSLATLAVSGAIVEVRTVISTETIDCLPHLARWIAAHLGWSARWSIMQLEQQGFARNRWNELFFDHSEQFEEIHSATSLAQAAGLPVSLFNFPRCTLPEGFREMAPASISDWKRSFPSSCNSCHERLHCSGLFAWHEGHVPFRSWGPV